MVRCPRDMNAFEFAVVAGLRAAQLQRGCTARVERSQKHAVTAQQEVAQRQVRRMPAAIDGPSAVDRVAAGGVGTVEQE